ncbi:MAG: hypothetical protein QE285_06820 [Aquabacterium sp.]|nr:hypothetical protein [Aquabacterium sp.]
MNSYPAPAFDALTYIGMLALVGLVLPWAAWVFSAPAPARLLGFVRLLGVMLLVAAFSAALAASGLLARMGVQPPALAVLTVATQALLLWHALSPRGALVAQHAALPALVLLQAFRLPLELLMLHAAQVGVMPVEFSMVGYNLDVVTGAVALPLGVLLWRRTHVPPLLVWLWNVWGMACLLVIVGLALATSPNLALFGNEPAHLSLWVLRFPYVWLPVLLVGVAVYGHVIVTRKLLRRSDPAPNSIAVMSASMHHNTR